MKRALIAFTGVVAFFAGFWGYAFEFAYFTYFKLNVHATLGLLHFIYSGLSVVIPLFAIVMIWSLLWKFLSPKIEQNDLKVIRERLAKSKFSEEIVLARVGFFISLIYLFLVLFDIQPPRFNGATSWSLGFLFWLLTFFNFQLFFGAIWLSPPYSRAAVVIAFALAVAMCFAAGGLEAARLSSQSKNVLRDDQLVKLYRKDGELIVEPKKIDLPLPLLNRALQWLGAKHS